MSQEIVPLDAYDIEVFAIKPDEQGNLFAYIGYKISNGDFHFNVVPFTEPKKEQLYSEEEMEFIKRCIKIYWEYHSNRVHPDNQNDWNISQNILNK